jgi:hypothetical protein
MNFNYKYACDYELWMRFFRYSKLYSLEGLIGCFRHRTSGQISKKFINEYYNEVDVIINYEKNLPENKKNMSTYRVVRSITRILNVLKIFNVSGLLRISEVYLFKYPETIRFNYSNQAFYLDKK